METVFLARHGRHHQLLPREVPYQANIWAMRQLNVRWLISVSAVGSLQEHLRPRDMVVPDQFIDRTQQRPQSFFGDGCVAHVSLADPFCPRLSELLAEAAASAMPAGHHLHRGGTYLCMEGPCVLNASRKPAVPKLGMLRDRHDQSHRSATGPGS
jgi:5'-methylthioadenosine phosphorylase